MIDQIDADERQGEAEPRERVLQVVVGNVYSVSGKSGHASRIGRLIGNNDDGGPDRDAQGLRDCFGVTGVPGALAFIRRRREQVALAREPYDARDIDVPFEYTLSLHDALPIDRKSVV